MDSIQIKTRNYVGLNEICIAQVVAFAEDGGFRIFVAWEWKEMASQGVFVFVKSDKLYQTVTEKAINETASYGWDISGTEEAEKIFSNLF